MNNKIILFYMQIECLNGKCRWVKCCGASEATMIVEINALDAK